MIIPHQYSQSRLRAVLFILDTNWTQRFHSALVHPHKHPAHCRTSITPHLTPPSLYPPLMSEGGCLTDVIAFLPALVRRDPEGL